MSHARITKILLLPELKFQGAQHIGLKSLLISCEKRSELEVCPKCAHPSSTTYDHRTVRVRDALLHRHTVTLSIRKRRLWCRHCLKPFTEPIGGISKGKRHTQRLAQHLRFACEQFTDLKKVRYVYRCSAGFLYKTFYQQLELRQRTRRYPWPQKLGIDEHHFRRHPQLKIPEYATVLTDIKNHRVFELAQGKSGAEIETQLAHIPGRENVRLVAMDLCDPYKNFVQAYFPNARIVADKFHVLRLLTPSLLKARKEITGTNANRRARKLLLMSAHKLDHLQRGRLFDFLQQYPQLRELYVWKERLHGFYRIKGSRRARKALYAMLDAMAHSEAPEIRTLRKTLLKWREPILAYFETGLTNAMTEGFNNKAKLVKRRGYGYRSFQNYRLRVLDACA